MPTSDESAATPSRGRGRPRDESAGTRALAAARALLLSEGLSGVTLNAVATRAGISRSVLYDRWPTKAELIRDVMLDMVHERQPSPDTGSFAGDVTFLVRTLAEMLTEPGIGQVYLSLMSEAMRDPAAREVLAEVMRIRRLDRREVIDRAVGRGEVTTVAEGDLLIDACTGVLYARLIASAIPLDPTDAPHIVASVLHGSSVAPVKRGRR